jgi:uncharacterized membrane protein YidH (DUF202 family)
LALEPKTSSGRTPYLGIILGVAACLLLAAAAYFSATGIIESLYAYRSTIQILVVALVGLVLVGLTALIATFTPQVKTPRVAGERGAESKT